MELQDYLEQQLRNNENKENKDGSTGKNFRDKRPYKTDGEIILEVLKEKTKEVLKPVVEKIKQEIPNRLKKGWKRAFGARRKFAEADLDDTYYFDEEVPDAKEDIDVYEYYQDEDKKEGFDESYYIRDNVIIFPKSKLKKSKAHRIAQKTADLNYDYNYDYVDGNYPRRIPTPQKKKTPEKIVFDTSQFYKK